MITKVEELEAIYGPPFERSITKEIPFLNEDYRAFVEAAPFIVIATAGPEGLDCSPKGDQPGFVRVLDEKTLAVPDRPGNNRIDNLRNIIRDPRISLLFIIPGVEETLRVNGTATITNDPALLGLFAVGGKLPKTVILVDDRLRLFPLLEGACPLFALGPGDVRGAVPAAQRGRDACSA